MPLLLVSLFWCFRENLSYFVAVSLKYLSWDIICVEVSGCSFLCFIGSQNHRIVNVGRDLKVFWSNTLLKQKEGHLEQVVQNCVQLAFKDFQEGRFYYLSGQAATAQSLTVYPDSQMELAVFHFVPIASCPGTGHH